MAGYCDMVLFTDHWSLDVSGVETPVSGVGLISDELLWPVAHSSAGADCDHGDHVCLIQRSTLCLHSTHWSNIVTRLRSIKATASPPTPPTQVTDYYKQETFPRSTLWLDNNDSTPQYWLDNDTAMDLINLTQDCSNHQAGDTFILQQLEFNHHN